MARINHAIRHSVIEVDRQLGVDHAPVLTPPSPLFRNVHHRQIQHFEKAVIRRENGFCLCHLAQLAVKTLNGVGGINQSPDFLGELEIGAQVGPVVPPGGRDVPRWANTSNASSAEDSSTAV